MMLATRDIIQALMQKNIHPAWHNQVTVTCVCGNKFVTGSTVDNIQVDLCSACHPFFTGEMKFVDRQGRVDRFRQKQQAAKKVGRGGRKQRQQKKVQSQGTDDQATIQSFKDILQKERKSVA